MVPYRQVGQGFRLGGVGRGHGDLKIACYGQGQDVCKQRGCCVHGLPLTSERDLCSPTPIFHFSTGRLVTVMSVARRSPVEVSTRATSASSLVISSRPSGEKAKELIVPRFPSIVRRSSPVCMSHSCTLPDIHRPVRSSSQGPIPPVASVLPSGEKARRDG